MLSAVSSDWLLELLLLYHEQLQRNTDNVK